MIGSGTTYGSLIKFVCNDGFKVVGLAERRCQADREWSGQEVTCEEINCGTPGPLWNGYLDGHRTTVGAVYFYSCLTRTKFEGSSFSTQCLENGQWSHPPPKCLGQCQVPSILNGTVMVGHEGVWVDHGTIINFECENGLVLNDTKDVRCNNGTWSVVPQCVRIPFSVPPKMAGPPMTSDPITGIDFRMICEADGTTPLVFQFKKGGVVLHGDRYQVTVENEPLFARGTLVIEKLVLSDEDSYTCEASNIAGKVEETVYIDTIVPPVLQDIHNQTAAEGSRWVELVCTARADPAADVQWMTTGSDIIYDGSISGITVETRTQEYTLGYIVTKKLKFDNLKQIHTNNYTCIAGNVAGMDSKDGSVIVTFKPNFDNTPYSSIYGWQNQNTEIKCVVDAVPDPSITWWHNNKKIEANDIFTISQERGIRQLTGILTVRVNIANVETIFGTYMCAAANTNGEATHDIVLQKAVRPQTPVVSIQEVTPTTIELLISPPENNGGQAIIDYRIVYQQEGKPKTVVTMKADTILDIRESEHESDPMEPRTRFLIEGLKARTKYIINVAARNAVDYGAEVTVRETTPSVQKPGVPRIISPPRSDTANTYNLRWQISGTGGAPLTGYNMKYTQVEVSNKGGVQTVVNVVGKMETTRINERTASSHTLNRLMPDAYYEVELAAINLIGESQAAKHIFQTIKGGTWLSEPRELTVNINEEKPLEVSLHWLPPLSHNSPITGYQVFTTTYVTLADRDWAVDEVRGDTLSIRIEQLASDLTYYFKVRARSWDYGPMSEIVTHKTPKVPVPNLGVNFTTSSEIKIAWTPPPEGYPVTGHRLYVNNSEPPISIELPFLDYTITDLIPDTMYHIQLSAFVALGEGPRTPVLEVKTKQFIPRKPRRVWVKAVNSTGIHIKWRAPAGGDDNRNIRGYHVHVSEVDSHDEVRPGTLMYSTDKTKHEMIITELETGTRYSVRVAAYTRKGDGVRSAHRIFTLKGKVPSPSRNVRALVLQEDPPTINITWQRPFESNGAILNYKVVWGRSGHSHEELTLSSTNYSHVLHSLDLGARYEVRVAARNDIGYGKYSTLSFQAPAGVPEGPPRNLAAKISGIYVIYSWDPPEPDLCNGDIKGYNIQHWNFYGYYEEEFWTSTIFGPRITRNVDYMFRARARTSKGPGPWSDYLQFRKNYQIPKAPKNVKIRWISDNDEDNRILEVTWNEPDIPVAGYKIYYYNSTKDDMSKWYSMETGPYTIAHVTGYSQDSIFVQVGARSTVGHYGNISEIVSTNSGPSARDGVKNLHVAMRTSGLIRLSWSKTPKKGVSYYVIKYKGQKSYRENGVIKHFHQKTEVTRLYWGRTTWWLGSLQPKTKYSFNISARFHDGSIGEDQRIMVETLIEAPASVRTPQVIRVKDNKVTLGLTPASERNGPISYYHLIVIPQEGWDDLFEYVTQDFTFDMLIKGTRSSRGYRVIYPYIAARFDLQSLPSEFDLGDNQYHGGFGNRVLDKRPNIGYKIFLRAYTVDPHLYTSSEYSEIMMLNTEE